MKKIILIFILILLPISLQATQKKCEIPVFSYANLKKAKRYYCNKDNQCYTVKKSIPMFAYLHVSLAIEIDEYLLFKKKETLNHCYQSKQSPIYFEGWGRHPSWNFEVLNETPLNHFVQDTFPNYHLPLIDEKNSLSLMRFSYRSKEGLDKVDYPYAIIPSDIKELVFNLASKDKELNDSVKNNFFDLLPGLPSGLVYPKPDNFFKKNINRKSSDVMILKSKENNSIQVRIHEENKRKNTYKICNYLFLLSEDQSSINYNGLSCIIYYQYKINLDIYHKIYSEMIDDFEFLQDIKKIHFTDKTKLDQEDK